jgi:hypothetical protein
MKPMKQIAHIQNAESSSAFVSRSDRDMNVFMAYVLHIVVIGELDAAGGA